MTTEAERVEILRQNIVRKMKDIRGFLNPKADLRVTLIVRNLDHIEQSILITADTPEGVDEVLAHLRQQPRTTIES